MSRQPRSTCNLLPGRATGHVDVLEPVGPGPLWGWSAFQSLLPELLHAVAEGDQQHALNGCHRSAQRSGMHRAVDTTATAQLGVRGGRLGVVPGCCAESPRSAAQRRSVSLSRCGHWACCVARC